MTILVIKHLICATVCHTSMDRHLLIGLVLADIGAGGGLRCKTCTR